MKAQERMAGAQALLDRNRESRFDLQKSREDLSKRMEESRSTVARQREEDLEFRQRLIAEIQRHNELLEALISKVIQR